MSRHGFLRWLSRLFPSAVPSPRPRAFRPRVEGLEDRLAPATFTVTNVNNGGAGSLRTAIVNANTTAGADTINFAIPGPGVKVINLRSALPAITETVTIDGTSQPTFTQFPMILLNGASAGVANGLQINAGADNCVVKGLVIGGFRRNGIQIQSNGNTVLTCYIGTTPSGLAAMPNKGSGVLITGTATGNSIGGTTTAIDGNLISGNRQYGVLLAGAAVTGNTIVSNAIGLDLSLNVPMPNRLDGVGILQGAGGNTVGGPGGTNLIEGNRRIGVNISAGAGNTVTNNVISFNSASGVVIGAGATGTVVDTNTLSSNRGYGIAIAGVGTSGNTVRANSIGTNGAGNAAFPNRLDGVLIAAGAQNNTIGGPSAGDRNIISANGRFGVNISGSGTTGNVVSANRIGVTAAGTALGNRSTGVLIAAGASGNTIGGTTAGAQNLISANRGHGVVIAGAGTTTNVVEGNFIGTNVAGTGAMGNGFDGVIITSGATSNTVGGTTAGAGNVISGNRRIGVTVLGGGVTLNVVQGNTIGLNAAGTAAVPNLHGVVVANGANNTTIGGTAAGAGNVISGNTAIGLMIFNADDAVVEGNFIGTGPGGTGSFPNGLHGVLVTNGADGADIGGTAAGAGNVIANNGRVGVLIGSDPTIRLNVPAGTGNSVLGNSIFNNALLGIDLGARNGITANDAGDADTGPNNLQNFPTITSAVITAGTIAVSVSLSSTPSTTFRVEVFANTTADPSGNGEGQTFLGFITVTTDGTGNGVGLGTFSTTAVAGAPITATATNVATNDTSEFSPAFTAT